jgi:hypothetical protein
MFFNYLKAIAIMLFIYFIFELVLYIDEKGKQDDSKSCE